MKTILILTLSFFTLALNAQSDVYGKNVVAKDTLKGRYLGLIKQTYYPSNPRVNLIINYKDTLKIWNGSAWGLLQSSIGNVLLADSNKSTPGNYITKKYIDSTIVTIYNDTINKIETRYHAAQTFEPKFIKGNVKAGYGIKLTGDSTEILVGSNDLTIGWDSSKYALPKLDTFVTGANAKGRVAIWDGEKSITGSSFLVADTITKKITITKNNLGAVISGGIELKNNTPATVSTQNQPSPPIILYGSQWDTDDAVSRPSWLRLVNTQNASGASPQTSLKIQGSENGSTWADFMTIQHRLSSNTTGFNFQGSASFTSSVSSTSFSGTSDATYLSTRNILAVNRNLAFSAINTTAATGSSKIQNPARLGFRNQTWNGSVSQSHYWDLGVFDIADGGKSTLSILHSPDGGTTFKPILDIEGYYTANTSGTGNQFYLGNGLNQSSPNLSITSAGKSTAIGANANNSHIIADNTGNLTIGFDSKTNIDARVATPAKVATIVNNTGLMYRRSIAADSVYYVKKDVDKAISFALTGTLESKGNWSVAGGTLPTTSVLTGDKYTITNGTVYITPDSFYTNDVIIAKIDNPGQTVSNWNHIYANQPKTVTIVAAGSSVNPAVVGYTGITPTLGKWYGLAAGTLGYYGSVYMYGTNNVRPTLNILNDGAQPTLQASTSYNNGSAFTAQATGTNGFGAVIIGKGSATALISQMPIGASGYLYKGQTTTGVDLITFNNLGKGTFNGGLYVPATTSIYGGLTIDNTTYSNITLNHNSSINPALNINVNGSHATGGIIVTGGASAKDLLKISSSASSSNNYLMIDSAGLKELLSIDKRGHLKLYNTAKAWNDVSIGEMKFPASGASIPVFTTGWAGSALMGAYYFQGSIANDIVYFDLQIPHEVSPNDSIRVHVHGAPTTAPVSTDSVVFRFNYSYAEIGSAFPTVTSVRTVLALNGVARWQHQLHNVFTNATGSGLGISGVYNCSIERLQDDTSDTYTGNYGMISIDCHAKIQGFGSRFYNAK